MHECTNASKKLTHNNNSYHLASRRHIYLAAWDTLQISGSPKIFVNSLNIVGDSIRSWVCLNFCGATSAAILWIPGIWSADKCTLFWIQNSHISLATSLHVLKFYFSLSIDVDTVFPLTSAGPQISVAPLGIHIEITTFPLISAAPLNTAPIRIVTIFY